MQKKYQQNGKLLNEAEIVDELAHGITKSYYETGDLEGEVEYVKNKASGSSINYH
eukprot:CAMPEP_0170567970 /NCGR_PEP_ID=MMETSP0211-20121228/80829_1 /TAXON_ID=311385 /ORGANISM="Pseudokeronopsis sp., Strain OXSARD2" /LENGTH=54 /DNA_ID=CAMNT_0010889595 /DNA_START=701 /DNA_END=865 /DNA_ORIENTATION=+